MEIIGRWACHLPGMPTNGSCRITACLILRQKHRGKNNKEPKPREHHEVETTSNQKHICVVPALAGDTDTMRSLYSPSAPLIPNYKLRFSTTAAAKKRPHSSYGFPIVSTTLNPNSPGCTEVRSTLVMLISDSPVFFFHADYKGRRSAAGTLTDPFSFYAKRLLRGAGLE